MAEIDSVRLAAMKIRQGEAMEIALDESVTDILVGYPIGGAAGWLHGKSRGKRDAARLGLAAGLTGSALLAHGMTSSWAAGDRAAEAERLEVEDDERRVRRNRRRRVRVHEDMTPVTAGIRGFGKAKSKGTVKGAVSLALAAVSPEIFGIPGAVIGGFQHGKGVGYEKGFDQALGQGLGTGAALGTAGVVGAYGASRYLNSRARRRREAERRRAENDES